MVKKIKKLKDVNAPVRPLSAYMLYAQKRRKEMAVEENNLIAMKKSTEIVSKIAEEWRELEEDEKKEFREAASALNERYKVDLEAYKQTAEYADFQRKKKEQEAISGEDSKKSKTSKKEKKAKKVKKVEKENNVHDGSDSGISEQL
ncbi:HM20A [Hepatospora eriocheir]|uniref:HM20A n=1 Tax=Hepatospora eriocheir TaxID=1081669 RepID=A0A1X0QBZ0_9MICR|nr:HM20A [Hepatospora eriocheir]